jgi:hypothetical protein
MIQHSNGKRSGVIWESADDLYPSLRAFCTYEPPRFTITVRNRSGAEKSIAFDQYVGPAYKVDAADRKGFEEVAIILACPLVAELRLRPVEL